MTEHAVTTRRSRPARRWTGALAATAIGASLLAGCNIAGDDLCGMVLDGPGPHTFTMTSDANCAAGGLSVLSNSAGAVTLDLDLGGYSLNGLGGAPISIDNTNAPVTINVSNGTIASDGFQMTGAFGNFNFDDVTVIDSGIDTDFVDLNLTNVSFQNSPINSWWTGGSITDSDFDGSVIDIDFGENLTITNSRMHDGTYGVDLNEGTVTVIGGEIDHNNVGATSHDNGGTLTLDGVDIHDNGTGVVARGFFAGATVVNSDVHHNDVGIRSIDGDLDVSNNTIHDNDAAGVDAYFGSFGTSSVDIDGNTIENNGAAVDQPWEYIEYLPGNQVTPVVPSNDGITVYVAGFGTGGTVSITNNNLVGNHDHGVEIIDLDSPATISLTESGNTASGNGGSPQCVGVSC